MEDRELIRLRNICDSTKKIQVVLKRRENRDLVEYILKKTPKLDGGYYTFMNRVYWLYHGIDDFPVCKLCGCNKKLTEKKSFLGFSDGYRDFCCISHAQKDPKTKQSIGDTVVDEIEKEGNYPLFESEYEELKFLNNNYRRKMSIILCSSKKKYLRDYIFNYSEKLQSGFYTDITRSYWVLNGLTDFPVCKTCGKMLSDRNVRGISMGYPNFCCDSCLHKNEDIQEAIKLKNNEKFGTDWPLQSKKIQLLAEQTKITKYNDPNYRNKEKTRQTNIRKYGGPGWVYNHDLVCRSRQPYLYDNMSIRSGWELYTFIYLKDNNIEFQYQPNISFSYTFNGSEYRYFPDFKINEKIYEIKGDQFFDGDIMICPYRKKNWTDQQYLNMCQKYEAKHQCMIKNNVTILRLKEIKPMIKYVDDKYGKNYIKQFRIKK